MRFTRRNRGPLAWARRARPKTEEPDFKPVENQEREALLSVGTAVPSSSAFHFGEADASRTDPTQRMLTALGRFHKQVAKAKIGAAQELWSDECMRELIGAAEIAVAEGWKDAVVVLTDAGRVLQTYEDAGRARDCVSFLAEVYEILSLMVGDLIVGDVRPGVLRKWKECRRRALEELEAAGLTLLRDDEDEPREDAAVNAASRWIEQAEEQRAEAKSEGGAMFPFDMPSDKGEEPYRALADEEYPSLDDLPPLTAGLDEENEPINMALLDMERDREPEPVVADTRAAEPEGELFAGEPEDSDEADAEIREESVEEAEDPAEEEPEVVSILDALCDGLGRIERAEGHDLTSTFAAMEEGLSFLEARAEEFDQDKALIVCRSMGRLCQTMARAESAANDRFLELGYAFCGVYMDAKGGADSASVDGWVSEADALFDQLCDAEIAEEFEEEYVCVADSPLDGDDESVVEPVEEHEETLFDAPAEDVIEPEDDSPEALLRVAQQAVSRGQVANAKLFAMQAAVGIARGEAAQAAARARDAENRLQQCSTEIDTARHGLVDAEDAVKAAEARVSGGVDVVGERERVTQEAACALTEVDDRLAELDERIRELQAMRDEEARNREESNRTLEAERDAEERAKAELEELRAGEEDARIRLEECRQQVKNLERKRSECESEMVNARDMLARQRNSVADIEQTIEQIRRSEAGETAQPTGDESMLF